MVLVTYWSFPGTPQQRTHQYPDADRVVTTGAGVLEVRTSADVVVHAYAPGRWVEGWVQD